MIYNYWMGLSENGCFYNCHFLQGEAMINQWFYFLRLPYFQRSPVCVGDPNPWFLNWLCHALPPYTSWNDRDWPNKITSIYKNYGEHDLKLGISWDFTIFHQQPHIPVYSGGGSHPKLGWARAKSLLKPGLRWVEIFMISVGRCCTMTFHTHTYIYICVWRNKWYICWRCYCIVKWYQ